MPESSSLPIRTLGRAHITVPAVGIRCWAIGGGAHNLGMPMGWSTGENEAAALAGLETAWRLGARLYDTADVYGLGRSERRLAHLVELVPRDQIVLSSKVGYFAGTAPHGFDPGHMRRQLEQSLDNLGTDHLDVYALHHADFGSDDRWLAGAVAAMQRFKGEGLIRAVGMRGPHRFALDRLEVPASFRGDKIARFQAVFDLVQPDIVSVRDNLLTPTARSDGIFEFARSHGCGVLINKPLGQGVAHRCVRLRPGQSVRRRGPPKPETMVHAASGRDHPRWPLSATGAARNRRPDRLDQNRSVVVSIAVR